MGRANLRERCGQEIKSLKHKKVNKLKRLLTNKNVTNFGLLETLHTSIQILLTPQASTSFGCELNKNDVVFFKNYCMSAVL